MTTSEHRSWRTGLRIVRRLARRGGAVLLGHILGSRLFLPKRVLPQGGPQRLLVIRIDERVGNVLLTSPLLTSLARALPRARIDVLVAASKARLVDPIVGVIPFDRRSFFVRPWSFLRAMIELRRARYDVAIDASHWHQFSASSAMLLAWTGAPLRIAHRRGVAALYANALVDTPQAGSEVEAKLQLLGPLGIGERTVEMSTPVGREGPARQRMEAWLRAEGIETRRRVALLPGARKLDHRVDPQLFVEIGREARRFGAEVLVLWGPGEEDLARHVATTSGGKLAPPTDLDELAALLRLSDAAVTNDTGPMHLAVACGAPTIALFSQVDHGRWGHTRAPHAVLPVAGRERAEIVSAATAHLVKVLGIPSASH